MTSRLASVGALLAVTALTGLVGYFRMFAGFSRYDDEGTVLVSLKLFMERGGLYDLVVAQYGPFYYELWGGLLSVLGVPVGHDAGRALALVAWVAAGTATGIVTLRVLRSLTLAVIAQLLTFSALVTLAFEPLHPGSLICALLSTMVVVASFVGAGSAPGAAALLGALMAALLFVKVNIGGFAVASLALAVVSTHPAFESRRALRALVELAVITLPLVLMNQQLVEHAWARRYALHVMLAAGGVVVWLRRSGSGAACPPFDLRWLIAGFLAVAFMVTAIAILTGTSSGGLVRGMVLTPAGQAAGFSLPLELSDGIMGLDVVAATMALASAWLVRRRPPAPAAGGSALLCAARVAIGVAMALAPTSQALPRPLAPALDGELSMLAFVWVALTRPPRLTADDTTSFVRRFLPSLATLQALHAFPVAGSQLAWASFLLVPIGVITAADGARDFSRAVASPVVRRGFGHAGRVLGIAVLLLVADRTLREPLREYRKRYDEFVPLDLRGARRVRVAEPEARLLRRITTALEEDCGNFLTLPGMSSFYLWTGKNPPSLNPAGFLTLFDVDAQRRVIAAVEPQRDLCLLKNPLLHVFWARGRPETEPLLEFMGREFVLSRRYGTYQLWRRRS